MSLVVGNFKMVSQLSGTLRIPYPSSHFQLLFACVLDNPSVMWTKNRLNYNVKSQMAKEKSRLTIYWRESLIVLFVFVVVVV